MKSARYWVVLAGFALLYIGFEVMQRHVGHAGLWFSIAARALLVVGLVTFQLSSPAEGGSRAKWIVVVFAFVGAAAAEFLLWYLLDWGQFQPSFAVPLATHVDTCLEGSALAIVIQYVGLGLRR